MFEAIVVDAAGDPSAAEAVAVLNDLATPSGEKLRVASVHAADSAAIEAAVASFGPPAIGAKECLFATEAKERAKAARAIGLTALVRGADFGEWAEAPLVVAHRVNARGSKNVETALRAYLAARPNSAEVVSVSRAPDGRSYRARIKAWVPIEDLGLGSLSGVHVALPAEAAIVLADDGRCERIDETAPDAESLAEARAFVRTLSQNRQVASGGGPPAPGATHRVDVDARGRRRLKRIRFSGA